MLFPFLVAACASASPLPSAAPGPPAAPKQLVIARADEGPKIDGVLDEAIWRSEGFAREFVQYSPNPGRPARQKTSVWIAYDDEALYVAARMYDSAPDSILRQLSERDNLGNTDWFAVSINPYRDGINASNFLVTPGGVQYDAKFNAGSNVGGNQVMTDGDRSWDAVWASAATTDERGWTLELRIPYMALRFPDDPVQTWDINFARQTRRYREESFWNPVDPQLPGVATQMGVLEGITDVKPPVRLSATPFVVVGGQHTSDPEESPRNAFAKTLGGGLDVKYGINDAFTLDMTLVPDFSDARSDDQVLNLGAREVRFSENRAFFTEGVELFTKGNFFYSRRIGGPPLLYGTAGDSLAGGEEVIASPARAQLLNATKVTGRMQNGLGIGVFNAVENTSFATIRTAEGSTRKVRTSPLTNYSVVSFDQNLPNNSFVTLLNTNVLRSGGTYDANLTALVFDLRTASNTWGVSGRTAVSQRYADGEVGLGHTYRLDLRKLSGRFQYGASVNVESDTYDPNDLGFVGFNNERTYEVDGEYNWFEPFGAFNGARVGGGVGLSYRYDPDAFAGSYLYYNSRLTTRDFVSFGVRGFAELSESLDYNDTRTPGRFIRQPAYTEVGGFVSTDYRKPFALDLSGSYGGTYDDSPITTVELRLSPRVRVSDRFDFRFSVSQDLRKGGFGYVGHSAEAIDTYELLTTGTPYRELDREVVGYDALGPAAIVVGYRDVSTTEVEGGLNYSLSAQMTLSGRIRHYWSKVNYLDFAELGLGGELLPTAFQGSDGEGLPVYDDNFNAFNVDLFYRWRFAPGSDILLSYKTQSFFAGDKGGDYFENLATLGRERVDNSLTLKVIYFLDAQRFL